MTRLLDEAIARLRQLPYNVQDAAATAILLQLEEEPDHRDTDAIKRGRSEIERGEFISLEQWRHDMGGSHR